MKNRGRQSSSELAVLNKVEEITRPDAPYDLGDEAAKEWWAVVNNMPAFWFPRETHALLSQYCRLVVRSRRLAQLIDQMETAKNFDVKEYQSLVRSEGTVSRDIACMATKLRISQQATFDRTKPKSQVTIDRPWKDRDDDDDDE